jgi:hypothetical protein
VTQPYTEEDVQAATASLVAISESRGRIRQHAERDARAVLDAVAKSIATRAKVDILQQFAEHDISGVLPHGDISNRWYHEGIRGAQDEARVWIDYVKEGL